MATEASPWPAPRALPDLGTPEHQVAELVGQVYAQAPLTERGRLLATLLPSAGLLSLVAVANGVFARIRLDEHWPSLRWLHGELVRVQPADVSELVERLQYTRSEVLDALMQWVSASPVLASCAAATVLAGLLIHRRSQSGDDGMEPPP